MKMKYIGYIVIIFILHSCTRKTETFQKEVVDTALVNGEQANECYVRSLNFVKGWLTKADSTSGLIPTNLTGKIDIWEPCNSAADNYPYMVLTSYLLDKDLFNGRMLDILKTEKRLTSRVKSLPDTYSFSKRGFKSDIPDMNWVIFGAAEYMKDGLIPLCEYIGKSPWTNRMTEMLDDLSEYCTVFKDVDRMGEYMVASEEINGDLLQSLSRMYWMSGEKKYLDRAIEIGDHYMLGSCDLVEKDYLRMRDHGCEIIGGLSELYVTLHFVNPEKKKQYQAAYYKLLNRILEVGRNKDGLFYNAVNPVSGEVTDNQLVDNWGYILDAYYTVWMVDKNEKFREAVLKSFTQLYKKYRDYPWEGTSHDGYADALESGINLYNRESSPVLKEWIDSEMKVMFKMQHENGILAGTHADGNFARTAIMYALWKSQGACINPWRNDVLLGAVKNGDEYGFVLNAQNDWEGKLVFDTQRHKKILHLPIDYPRINQFPEWFTVKDGKGYLVVSSQKELNRIYTMEELRKGLPLKLKANETLVLSVCER